MKAVMTFEDFRTHCLKQFEAVMTSDKEKLEYYIEQFGFRKMTPAECTEMMFHHNDFYVKDEVWFLSLEDNVLCCSRHIKHPAGVFFDRFGFFEQEDIVLNALIHREEIDKKIEDILKLHYANADEYNDELFDKAMGDMFEEYRGFYE